MSITESVSPLSTHHADRFLAVRALTDRLTAPLSAEDQTPQSMTEASPAKWHRAHVTWFFEEFILRQDPSYVVYDDTFRYLFNSYYEAVGDRHPRPDRGLVTRPGVADIAHYREYVDAAMVEVLERGALDDDALALLELGCNHEQQHQELILMDIKHLFSTNSVPGPGRGGTVGPVYVDRPADDSGLPGRMGWRPVPGGVVEIGTADAGGGSIPERFAYDNEGPRHRVFLEDFEIADRAVTNADWLEFMADDGYRRPELWLSDGWAHIRQTGWEAPGYWRRDDAAADQWAAGQGAADHGAAESAGWTTFTLSGRRPLVLDEPVLHVSFYEADAFARWAGARLPTEFEWETAAASVDRPRGELLDPARCHPGAATGAMIGDVWEWTSSAYLPYPGFAPANGAVGEYNGKFMSDQHVLRGASAVTPPGHERTTYRNFFPAPSRWVFAGLRLAR
ncbi:ergothioneine biosynthesis protein EgtB [Gordonia sp. NPDC003425]